MSKLHSWWRSRGASLRRRRSRLRSLEHDYENRLARGAHREISALERRVARRAPRLARVVVGPAVEIAERLRPDDVSTHAGAMTYGAFLSIPPLVLFAGGVAGFVFAGRPEAEARAIGQLIAVLPGLRSVVSDSMKATIDGRVSFSLLGLAVLLWAASGFASRARHALGEVFGTERTGLIGGRFVGMIIGILIVGAIVGLAILTALAGWVDRFRPNGVVLSGVLYIVLVAGEFVFFVAVYRTLTPKGPKLAVHLPGAILFIVAWEALKGLAGLFFAQVVARSTALYGTLGTIFAFISFLYGTMWLLLVGAETSVVLARRRAASPL